MYLFFFQHKCQRFFTNHMRDFMLFIAKFIAIFFFFFCFIFCGFEPQFLCFANFLMLTKLWYFNIIEVSCCGGVWRLKELILIFVKGLFLYVIRNLILCCYYTAYVFK